MKILDAIRARRDKREHEIAKALLNKMIDNKDPEIYDQIRKIVNIKADRLLVQWLDSRRIAHCMFCSRTDTLRKRDGKWLCEPHFQMPVIDLNPKEGENAVDGQLKQKGVQLECVGADAGKPGKEKETEPSSDLGDSVLGSAPGKDAA